MARWLPSAIGPFMDIDAIFYAGAAHINGLEPEYVLSFYFSIYAVHQPTYISRTDEEIYNIRLFNTIIRLCPKLKKVIKSFEGDEDVMKDFLRIVSRKCAYIL